MPRRSLTPDYTEVKIRTPLNCESKNGVCAKVLRRQPGQRPAGMHRRGGGYHRSSVHRRARYPADHAYLPYGRCCIGCRYHPGSSPCRGAVRGPSSQEQLPSSPMIDGVVSFEKDSQGRRQCGCYQPQDRRSGLKSRSFTALPCKCICRRLRQPRATLITEGSVEPSEILQVLRQPGCAGIPHQRSAEGTYRTQGVDINDKHIEVIVRQMMRKVKIERSAATPRLFTGADR